jgi:hypothetical protein
MRRRAMLIAGLMALLLGAQLALAGAAWSATGWTAYVSNAGGNTVAQISTATNTMTGTAIGVGTGPRRGGDHPRRQDRLRHQLRQQLGDADQHRHQHDDGDGDRRRRGPVRGGDDPRSGTDRGVRARGGAGESGVEL